MPEPLEILRSVFGYQNFRGEQATIIDEVVSGRNALVLMPTGGGKSLCYQVPALVRPGVGVVISPLIALMQDQVDALKELGVRAAYLNSSLTPQDARAVEMDLLAGELDVLYIAPERLVRDNTIDLLQRAPLALFAIDEAHCVSQWGHDFRADYLALGLLHERFPDVPRIALTATADQRTRAEIAQRLALEDARHFVAGFDRPNIQYRIQPKSNARQQLLRLLKDEHSSDAGIVYCLSRNKVDTTARWLREQGFNALPYHAGLDPAERQRNQARFLREESVIIVATIAFGMGIDKPDVRFVAHLDLPKSIEAYYQETGRAGRDGGASTAWMVYGLEDAIKLRQMMQGSEGDERHKRSERVKLDAMLALCETTDCRRQKLLAYFGEAAPARCGNCDSCLQPAETWDATESVQKALSCVYRTGQRFGVAHLVSVLRGESSERIAQLGHDQVSTFGIGADLDANQWRSVFRQLVANGYLQVDIDGFGGLSLTEACRDILRGNERVSLRRDPAPARRTRKAGGASASARKRNLPVDDPAWEALRACRKALADKQGVPPYVIFHDATLLEMLENRPRDRAALRAINGVGESKLERYGDAFLDVLQGL